MPSIINGRVWRGLGGASKGGAPASFLKAWGATKVRSQMNSERKTPARHGHVQCGLLATPASLEKLWVRLRAGDRIRPRDAFQLRRLSIPPFDYCFVYELDANGYVVRVGMPGNMRLVDADKVLSSFEDRFGVPETYTEDRFRSRSWR